MNHEIRREYPDYTMTSGPCTVSPSVLQALSNPAVYHYDPVFMEKFKDTCEKLKKVLFTENDVFVIQGDAVLALEASANSCIKPGDKCLNLASGYYGKGYVDYINAFGGIPIEIEVPYDSAVTVDLVEKAIEENPDIKILSMVHSETPSCTVNPVKEICQLAQKHGIITIVDSVSGVGSCEVKVDEFGIDICIVGSQKCLGAAPGLSIVSVSDAAWEKMRDKNPRRWSVLCMLDWKEMWFEKGNFPFTASVNLMYGLDQAVDEVLDEGMEHLWSRHDLCARMAREGLKAMGFELWAVSEDICATCSTAFKLPEGVDQLKFRYHLRDRYGVMISAGLQAHADKLLRLGHMGYTARPEFVMAALAAIGKSFADFGIEADLSAGLVSAAAIME